MDPDACLDELLELKQSIKEKLDKYDNWTDLAEVADGEEIDELIRDADDLVNHIDALHGWMVCGGFLPRRWSGGRKKVDGKKAE